MSMATMKQRQYTVPTRPAVTPSPRRLTHCWRCDKPLRYAPISVVVSGNTEHIVHAVCP